MILLLTSLFFYFWIEYITFIVSRLKKKLKYHLLGKLLNDKYNIYTHTVLKEVSSVEYRTCIILVREPNWSTTPTYSVRSAYRLLLEFAKNVGPDCSNPPYFNCMCKEVPNKVYMFEEVEALACCRAVLFSLPRKLVFQMRSSKGTQPRLFLFCRKK